ncbi:outer membrane protein assembly factor BamB family protein [Insolitispirillum peregrinum]|uniref:Outer membrane protein assembly factor BamB n=1 Tax=Insolitispirillum peregrinum TaxID=80876 RepID=A0A1N7Q5P4_9PROT|nr:PQQ-binding-like beta-propeller repeat protein [Insolitispirillum peregrinum]SIT18182.1 Outer membrane protein assembly factor BamB, contains PQQ-like beta-propeller repeat [Insolitispirillum peregrinum]
MTSPFVFPPVVSSSRRASGRVVRLASALAMITALSACGGGEWFGGKEDPPLPGTRVSILEHDRNLKPANDASTDAIHLPAPEPNDSWPQAGGYSHHAMQHMVVNAVPKKVWSTNVGNGTAKRNRLMSEPVVADNVLYVIDSSAEVSALDAQTGKTLWSVDLAPDYDEDESILGGGVAIDNGRLYVTTGFAEVFALDPKTGKTLWQTTVPSPMRAAPAVNGGRVFVVTVDNKGLALAASDGRILWTHAGVEEATTLLTGPAPAVDNGVVLMPYTSGEIAALRVDNGLPLWSDTVIAARRTDSAANLSDISARPVIDNNRVYVIGHSGLMVSIDLRTGDRAWEVELSSLSQPWLAGKFLYAVTTDAEVVCIDTTNGKILWVHQLAQWKDPEEHTGRILWTGPTLASDRLIVTGSNGELFALSPYDGSVLGKVSVSDGITLPPAVANNTLYFLNDAADILAFR